MSPAALALLPPVDFRETGPEQIVLGPRRAFVDVDLGMAPSIHQLYRRLRDRHVLLTRARFHPPRGRQLIFRQVILGEREHPKGKSLSINKLTPTERAHGKRLPSLAVYQRPKTRMECENSPRPCPWVSCRYHLYLDVARRAAHLNFPDIKPWEMVHSCALDVAEYGGVMLQEVGSLMNITMERARQIEEDAVGKMKLFAESRPESAFVRALEGHRST